MRALLIDPTTKSVEEIDYRPGPKAAAKAINAASGLICVGAYLPHDNVMFVDDEGRLVNPNPNGYFTLRGFESTVFCGKGLVVGTNERTGDDAPCNLDLEAFRRNVTYIDEPDPVSIEPSCEVMSLEEAADRNLLPAWMAGLVGKGEEDHGDG